MKLERDPAVSVGLRPRRLLGEVKLEWLADSGVRRSLLSEKDWMLSE